MEQRSALIPSVVHGLTQHYSDGAGDTPHAIPREAPSVSAVVEALSRLLDLLLPARGVERLGASGKFLDSLPAELSAVWQLLEEPVAKALPFRWMALAERKPATGSIEDTAESVLQNFFVKLPDIRRQCVEDIQAAYDGDPAALSYTEVMLAYPGVIASATHRVAHELYLLSVPMVPRIMSEWAHAQTGIDIHPGAQIGSSFFIDHGTGVVVGETAKIGARVKLYQGVTLGAKSFALDAQGNPVKHIQRHPTVEDDVVIYANATILGGTTVIGRGSIIGGNVFLAESVAPGSVVTRGEHSKFHTAK